MTKAKLSLAKECIPSTRWNGMLAALDVEHLPDHVLEGNVFDRRARDWRTAAGAEIALVWLSGSKHLDETKLTETVAARNPGRKKKRKHGLAHEHELRHDFDKAYTKGAHIVSMHTGQSVYSKAILLVSFTSLTSFCACFSFTSVAASIFSSLRIL